MLIFQKKSISWQSVVKQAENDARATQRDQNSQGTWRSCRVEDHNKRWKKPPKGYMKCNVDASFVNSEIPSKAGWFMFIFIYLY